jgi:UMF1 family MFS transporter
MQKVRTFIYIDGFNFYYGSLKDTTNKWLDFKKFFESVLDPKHSILSIKYFTAFIRLRHTLGRIRTFRELTKFLAAYLIYNEGIETVIIMASIFGANVLKMETGEIILFFLMIQGIAFFGSLAFGFLADAIGNKRTVMISLVIWSLIVVWAFRLGVI